MLAVMCLSRSWAVNPMSSNPSVTSRSFKSFPYDPWRYSTITRCLYLLKRRVGSTIA